MRDNTCCYLDSLRADILEIEGFVSLLESDLTVCPENRRELLEKMLRSSQRMLANLIIEENDYIKTLGFNDL